MASGDTKELAQAGGYDVREQPGGTWVWFLVETKEIAMMSFKTETDAWDNAAYETASMVMGTNDVSDEEWDRMGHLRQVEMTKDVMGSSPSP